MILFTLCILNLPKHKKRRVKAIAARQGFTRLFSITKFYLKLYFVKSLYTFFLTLYF